MSDSIVRLAVGDSALTIDAQHGATMKSLITHGLEVLVAPNKDGPIWSGAFPMVPWAGLLRGARLDYDGQTHVLPADWPPHALHGLLRTAAWKVTVRDGASAEFQASLGQRWPFGGQATLSVQLSPDDLSMTWGVQAEDRSFRCSVGWHPWFARELAVGGPLELELPATAQWQRDADGLPTGRWTAPQPPPWDDSFLVRGPAVLRWPGALELTLSGSHGVTSVYDGHEGGLVVTTQTAPHEALGHDLAAGGALELFTALAWQRL